MQRISITNPQNVINGTAKKYYFRLRNTGGPKGDKGDKGDTGATGPQGPQGNAATVSVGSTTTLPVGYDATVTNTGSVYNAVLDFGIPQGPQGPQGAKGDKGDTGAKGDTGPRGPQGERGTNATVYIGTTSTLAPGSQATVYNSGSDSNAVLNFGIPQGAKGDTGSQGPQGPAGQNFAPTVVAELPATGDESKLYLTPKSHTSQTATGNPITASISDCAGSMESFQLDGDTFQQRYTGKNLLGLAAAPTGNTYGLTPTIDDATNSLTINGTYNGGGGGYPWVAYKENLNIPAGTYKLSIKNPINVRFSLRMYRSDGTYPLGKYIEAGDTSATITIDFDCTRVAVLIGEYSAGEVFNNFKIENIQLESGSTVTDFEPYVGGIPSPNPDFPEPIQTVTETQTISINDTDYPLNLGSIELCKLGTYQDYIYKDENEWKIHKEITKVIFDGAEGWTQSSTTTEQRQVCYINAVSLQIKTGDARLYSLMSGFIFASPDYTKGGNYRLFNESSGVVQYLAIAISKENASSTTAFETWLGANPQSFYYVAATPTNTVITDQTLIAQLEAIRTAALENGANTIANAAAGSNLAGDMEISYYEYNPTNRYDKFIWLDLNNNYEQIGE